MVKRLEWTPELVERFWNGLAELPVLEQMSFARSAAPLLLPLVERFVPTDARAIDFGGGGGHLAEALMERGIQAAIYEPSHGRARTISGRLDANPRFLGIIGPENDGRFDSLFCLEVIEHVTDQQTPMLLAHWRGLLADHAVVVLTCPNREDLETGTVYCPSCDSTFHRWQHMRSLSHGDVVDMLTAAGFETLWLGLIGFEAGQALLDWTKVQELPGNFCYDEARRLYIETSGPCPDPKWRTSAPHDVDLRQGSERNIVYVGRKLPAGATPTGRIAGVRTRLRPPTPA
jgi:hypothetical protein